MSGHREETAVHKPRAGLRRTNPATSCLGLPASKTVSDRVLLSKPPTQGDFVMGGKMSGKEQALGPIPGGPSGKWLIAPANG